MKPLLIFMVAAACLGILMIQSCRSSSDPPPLSELDKLPKATQTGQGTLGCLINGKAFVAYGAHGTFEPDNLQLNGDAGNESVAFILYEKNNTGLTTQSYSLNNYPVDYPSTIIKNCIYSDSSCYKGTLTITHLDFTNKIVSGTFELNLAQKGCDSLILTNGRFDMRYDF